MSSRQWKSIASLVSLIALALDIVSARHGAHNALVRRHQHAALKESQLSHSTGTHGMSNSSIKVDVQKRAENARFTFFDVGLGACGIVNKDSDFIVALNIEQWDGGSHCFKQIEMNYNGKTTQATIMDMCPGCPYGGLDLSPNLFSFFAPQDEGVVYGSWSYGSSASVAKPKDQPQNSKKPAPPSQTHQAQKPVPTPSPDDIEYSTKSHASSTLARNSQAATPTQSQYPTQSLSTSHLSIPTNVIESTVNVAGGISLDLSGLTASGTNRGMTTRIQMPTLTVIDAAPSAPIFETTAAAFVPGGQNAASDNIEQMNRAIIDIAAFINMAARVVAN